MDFAYISCAMGRSYRNIRSSKLIKRPSIATSPAKLERYGSASRLQARDISYLQCYEVVTSVVNPASTPHDGFIADLLAEGKLVTGEAMECKKALIISSVRVSSQTVRRLAFSAIQTTGKEQAMIAYSSVCDASSPRSRGLGCRPEYLRRWYHRNPNALCQGSA